MSKPLASFTQKVHGIRNAPAKFTPSVVEGRRIVPAKNKDAEFQFRIDAGHYDPKTKLLNVVLQVNPEATSPILKRWLRTHSSHEKLATATFDTSANDKKMEFSRMIEALNRGARETLG